MRSQYENLTNIKMIEPKVWKEKYEVKGTEYGYEQRHKSDLIIEENTIYEIDTECIECRNSHK